MVAEEVKSKFAHYYQLTDDELSGVLDAGLFALDANVLLDLYRYTPATRRELMRILRKLRPRLWLPHQAAHEFHANRLGVLKETASKVAEAEKSLAALRKAVDAIYRTPGETAAGPAREALAGTFSRIERHLKATRESVIRPTVDLEADRVWGSIARLFDGKVGDPYDDARLSELYKEGGKRYQARRPPGFEDDQKQEPEKYGDLVLWRQMVDKAKSANRPVILITSERKADWWLIQDGESMGPRPELRAEMMNDAGQLWHMYRPGLFMSVMGEKLEVPASQPALDEVQSLGDRVIPPPAITGVARSSFGSTYADMLSAIKSVGEVNAFATGVTASNLNLIKDLNASLLPKFSLIDPELLRSLRSGTAITPFTTLRGLTPGLNVEGQGEEAPELGDSDQDPESPS